MKLQSESLMENFPQKDQIFTIWTHQSFWTSLKAGQPDIMEYNLPLYSTLPKTEPESNQSLDLIFNL